MTWATSVPILVFLGLSVLDLGPMYVIDRRQTDTRRQTASSLNAPPIRGGGIISCHMTKQTLCAVCVTVIRMSHSLHGWTGGYHSMFWLTKHRAGKYILYVG